MKIFIEDTTGSKFECDPEPTMLIATIAADFFDSMEWPAQDNMGMGQRAAVELVEDSDPSNLRTIRLRAEQTLIEAKVPEGGTLRIFPESIAGAMDLSLRNRRLVTDLREIENLCEQDDLLDYETNDEYAPDEYILYMNYPSFVEQPALGQRPKISNEHKILINLPSEYPLVPPIIKWLTPIFHPNIHQADRTVCLGQLNEKYIPSIGLRRIVSMLIEIARWRNFDVLGAPFNKDAAAWAKDPTNWGFITEIGGTYFQVPRIQMIDPQNWGTSNRNAIFYGKEQPVHFIIAWNSEQQRTKLKFKETKRKIDPF